MSRRAKRRLILVVLVMFAVGGGLGAVKLVRSVQQGRLLANARTAGLAAYDAGQYADAVEHLSFYVQGDREDVEVYLAFAKARFQVPMENGQHLVDALGLYKYSLKLLDADPSVEDRPAKQQEALEQLLDLYGLVGLGLERIKIADRILADEPNNVKALSARAAANFLDRDFDAALPDAERLAELEPDSLKWRQLQLETLRRLRVPDSELLALCQEWTAQYRGDGRFHVLKAGILASAGRIDEAREVIQQAADRGAETLPVLERMISTLDELQMRDVARDAVEQAKIRLPNEQWVRQAIVQRYWQSGHLEDALVELEQAEADFATLDLGLVRLKAMVLAAMGREEPALRVLKELQAAGADRDETAATWAAAIEAHLGLQDANWSQVMQKIDHALALDPTDPTLHLARGQAFLAVREYSQAVESLEKAVRLDPNWIAAGLAYAQVLQQTGRINEAFSAAQQVMRRADRSYLPPYLVYARAYLSLLESGGNPRLNIALIGHSSNIIQVFEDIQEQLPNRPEIVSLLAEVYARTGRGDRATQFILSVIGSGQPTVEVLLALVPVSVRHGLELEQQLVDAAWEINADNLAVTFALADLHARDGAHRTGLEVIDAGLARVGPEQAKSLIAQQGRIRHLIRMDHPTAADELRRFAGSFSDSAAAQTFVLSTPLAWKDQALAEQTIENLRTCLGPRSMRAQLAHTQYLVRFHADEEARLAEAIRLLSDILEQSPNSLAALTFMAEASLMGDHPSPLRAIEHLERAVSLAPGQVGLYPRLVTLLQQEGNFDAARRYLERYGEMTLGDERHQRQELELLRRQGQFETALVRASKMFDEHSEVTDQLVLASMHRRAGQYDEAESIYLRLLSAKDPSPMAVAEAAEFYAESGRFERGNQLLLDIDERANSNRPLLLGRFHNRHGKPDDAEEWFTIAVQQAPDDPQVRNEFARFYLGRNDYPQARQQALIGLKMAPEDARLRGTLALTNLNLEGTGRREAIEVLRTVGSENDDLLALLLLLEQIPVKDGVPEVNDTTLRAARRLVEEHGGLAPVWNVASRLFIQAGQVDDAIELARRAVSRFPAEPDPARWAAELLARTGRWDEALVEAQEWRRRSLHDPLPADAMIARILLREDRAIDAVEQLEPHAQRINVQRHRHPERLITWLEALMSANRRDAATTIALPLLEHDAEWRARWLEMSDRLPNQANYEALMMLAARDVDDSMELLRLGSAWHQLGLRTDQADHFERADQYAIGAMSDPASRNRALILRGTIAEARSDLAAAEKYYRQALSTDARSLVALNNLAYVLTRLDRSSEGLPLIEQAMEMNPEQPQLLDTYGNVLCGMGRLDEAEQALNQALAMRPADPAINLSLVHVLLSRGEYDLADDQLETARRVLEGVRRPNRSDLRRVDELDRRLRQLSAAVGS